MTGDEKKLMIGCKVVQKPRPEVSGSAFDRFGRYDFYAETA